MPFLFLPQVAPPTEPTALFTAQRFADVAEQAAPGKLKIRALMRLDRWEQAQAEAELLVLQAPNDADSWGLLALTRLRGGQPEAAQKAVETAKKLGATSYWSLLAQATLLTVWDDKDKAANVLVKKAVAQRPNEPEGWWLALQTAETDADARPALVALKRLQPKGHPFDEFAGDYDVLLKSMTAMRESKQTMEHNKRQIVFPPTARIPIQQAMGMVFVTVTINGVPLKLLFDTGAGTGLLVDRNRTPELHATFLTKTVIRGVQGKDESRMLRPNSVALGAVKFGPLPLRESPDTPYCDGIFGGSLLMEYAVTLDFANSEMVLKRGKTFQPTDKKAYTLPFKQLFGGNLYVPIRLNAPPLGEGQKAGWFVDAPFWAIIDSGAQTGLISRRLASALSLGLPDGMVRTIENNMPVGIGTSKASITMDLVQRPFSLLGPGGLSHPVRFGVGASPLDGVISPGTGFETGALLGMPFLSRYKRVTFDYPNKRLILEGAPPSELATTDTDGIRNPTRVPNSDLPEGKHWIFGSDSGWLQVSSNFAPKGTPTTLPLTIAPGYRAIRLDKSTWVLVPSTTPESAAQPK
ncbi:MAG: aspartyl protease family protein [Armatimonas sp.]